MLWRVQNPDDPDILLLVIVDSIELVSLELARKDDDDLSSERFISPWMILHLLFATASLILLGVFGPPDHQHEPNSRWRIVVYILHHMIPTALFIVPLLVIVRKYQMDEKEKQNLIERSKKQIQVTCEKKPTNPNSQAPIPPPAHFLDPKTPECGLLQPEIVQNQIWKFRSEMHIPAQVENELLSSLVPPSISQRLRSGEERIAGKIQPLSELHCASLLPTDGMLCADFYPSTTVMFIYFDDFDSILIEHGSVRTISWVNRVQLALDKMVHSCKGSVLKVQTFSNFYLVVAGCSQKGSASHAEDCVRAAVMMMMQARTLMDPNNQVETFRSLSRNYCVATQDGHSL